MSRSRFDEIAHCLRYTNDAPPTYCDWFFEIQKLVKAWNENMAVNFSPGWISCLDESMLTWANKYTCPGYMFGPRKPWPFGNKFHTIDCGVSEILYNLELVEGKDEPKKRAMDLRNLMMVLARLSGYYCVSPGPFGAWEVVLDSGFCVLQGLVELKKRGVYGAVLITRSAATGQNGFQVMQSLHTLWTKMLEMSMHCQECLTMSNFIFL
jgi:hypothetical protein